MNSASFKLIPHAAGMQGVAATYSLHGQISVLKATLQITYQLEGKLAELKIPNCSSQPLRQDLLWQATCLEFFLAAAGNSDYWEYNLSPAGDWNVYHLDTYRRGLAEEPAYKQLPFDVIRDDKQLNLSLTCALPPALITPTAAHGSKLGSPPCSKAPAGS